MATIIDFAQMRELLGPKSEGSRSPDGGPPEGKVILFTGVRYERGESIYEEGADPVEAAVQRKPRRKTKS